MSKGRLEVLEMRAPHGTDLVAFAPPLALVPFVTAWMGENHFAPAPTAPYGVVLLMAAIAYWVWCKRSSP